MPRAADRRRDAGNMSVEMVLMTPVLVMFLLLVVACGRYVSTKGQLESVSRDAVRAASLARDAGSAQAAADAAYRAGLAGTAIRCPGGAPVSNFGDGVSPEGNPRVITVTMQCTVTLSDLGLIGLRRDVDLVGRSNAPLDVYRRTGP